MAKSEKLEMFKKTMDDWCGSYEDENGSSLVRIFYSGEIKHRNEDPYFRVGAFGNDDFGLIYDTPDEEIAMQIFNMLMGMEYVNIEFLEEMGFEVF